MGEHNTPPVTKPIQHPSAPKPSSETNSATALPPKVPPPPKK